MSTLKRAWAAVFAAPENRHARHVLADALLEAGDPFGEYLALTQQRQTAKVKARLAELEPVREARLAPTARFFTTCLDDDAGLPGKVTCTARQVVQGFDALVRLGPRLQLTLAVDTIEPAEVKRLMAVDLGRFASVTVERAHAALMTDAQLGDTMERLAPALRAVTHLTSTLPLTPRALAALANSRRVPLLELWAPRPDLPDEQEALVRTLTSEPGFRSLQALSVSGEMPKKLVARLRALPHLRSLWVGEHVPLGSAAKVVSAARSGTVATLKKLLAAGHPVNGEAGGWTALQAACAEARRDAVRVLLEHGADLATPDEAGNLPIHLALEARSTISRRELDDRVAICLALMKAGSPIDTCDEEGFSVLAKACRLGRGKATTLVAALLAKRPSLDTRTKEDQSLLHIGASAGHLEVMRRVLRAHGDLLDDVDAHGNTALHLAAAEGQREAAFLLLEAGASTRVVNREQQRALDVARKDTVLRHRLASS